MGSNEGPSQETREQVDEFLEPYSGGGQDTQEQDGTIDAKSRARDAEEEYRKYEEAENAEPEEGLEIEDDGQEQEAEEAQNEETQEVEEGQEEDTTESEEGREESGLDTELSGDLEETLLGEDSSSDETSGDEAEGSTESSQVQELQNRIEELESRLDEDSQTVDTVDEPDQQEVIEFVSDEEDVQEVVGDPDNFNELMSRMFHTVREEITRTLPEVARQVYKTQRNVKQAVDSFFEENPDLREWETQVSAVAQEVQANNPNAGPKEVLNAAGDTVRDRLDLHKKAKETEEGGGESGGGGQQPPTPSSGGTPSTGDNRSDEEQAIGKMLDATE